MESIVEAPSKKGRQQLARIVALAGAALLLVGCATGEPTSPASIALQATPSAAATVEIAPTSPPAIPTVVLTALPVATTSPARSAATGVPVAPASPTRPAPPSPTPRPPQPTAQPTSGAQPATNTPVSAGVARPSFSDVARRTPADATAYLAGRLPDYPGSGPAALLDFSASDILETMDTAVLDTVRRNRGQTALGQVYDTIARAVLATLREQYGDRPLLVPLDAGHGGKRGFFWDSGSEGTEAEHTRAVVAAIGRLAQGPGYGRIVLRPIFSDDIADDFGLPNEGEKPVVSQMLMRQARASMLAAEAGLWNRSHPETAAQIAVHEISIHFNAGAGGAMVLHQGGTVRPEFAAHSLDFARRYLQRATADLNATGLLPAPLRLWGANGLHDDVMMYRPSYLSDDDIRGLTLRYSALQGGGYLARYAEIVRASALQR